MYNNVLLLAISTNGMGRSRNQEFIISTFNCVDFDRIVVIISNLRHVRKIIELNNNQSAHVTQRIQL